MADRGGTMAPFHCCPLCTDLCIVQPLFSARTRPAGTEMAAPLTRFTMPPVVHATMEGHGHRHLCGPQEAEAGAGGGLAGRWCCQRLRDVEVAFSFRGGEGLPVRAYQRERNLEGTLGSLCASAAHRVQGHVTLQGQPKLQNKSINILSADTRFIDVPPKTTRPSRRVLCSPGRSLSVTSNTDQTGPRILWFLMTSSLMLTRVFVTLLDTQMN